MEEEVIKTVWNGVGRRLKGEPTKEPQRFRGRLKLEGKVLDEKWSEAERVQGEMLKACCSCRPTGRDKKKKKKKLNDGSWRGPMREGGEKSLD